MYHFFWRTCCRSFNVDGVNDAE